jgi:hypothetical protein
LILTALWMNAKTWVSASQPDPRTERADEALSSALPPELRTPGFVCSEHRCENVAKVTLGASLEVNVLCTSGFENRGFEDIRRVASASEEWPPNALV